MTPEKFQARNHVLRCDFADYEEYKKSLRSKFWNFMNDNFSIRSGWDLLPFRWKMRYYDTIRPIFNPQNKRFRKAIPRTWVDISHLIEIINFEFIKGFYENEYLHGSTDWEGTGKHATEFAKWLESAYDYITIERPQLEKDMDAAYPSQPPLSEMFVPCETDENGKVKMFKMVDDGRTYEEKYGQVDILEQLIQDKDTELLTSLMKYRHFFWS
jgi:hypothetical protein